jgi:hypothetical protein
MIWRFMGRHIWALGFAGLVVLLLLKVVLPRLVIFAAVIVWPTGPRSRWEDEDLFALCWDFFATPDTAVQAMLIIAEDGAPKTLRRKSMGDHGLDGLFSELEATFEASVAREEEAAATDLGFALAQTNALRDVLPRLPHAAVLLEEGIATRLTEIGTDYVATSAPARLVPIGEAMIRASDSGTPPSSTEASLLLTLRRLARRRASIEVDCGKESRRAGQLVSAGEDYLSLQDRFGLVFIPLKLVSAIRLLCEPS